jgi:hypothetical protein
MSADRLITWLLEGPPWVQYRTRLDLLHQTESDPEVLKARQEMIKHRQVQGLLAELAQWPGFVLSSHKSAGHPLHKLIFVADLGLKATDPEIKQIIERICEHQAPEGSFQVLMNIPPRYGGTGKDQWAWALCDAPLILYALVKFGLGEDERIQKASAHLVSLIKENGWPCAVSEELGKFRGPGRKEDPCPYANLIMLKALAQKSEWRDSLECHIGAEALLTLWEGREKRHPYMFFMGTDFCKLKAPFVWYDLLHVVEVLTHFPDLRKDSRLKEMVEMIERKADGDGKFVPESVWQAWKGWDFGQKKEPSYWLTFLVLRIKKRLSS